MPTDGACKRSISGNLGQSYATHARRNFARIKDTQRTSSVTCWMPCDYRKAHLLSDSVVRPDVEHTFNSVSWMLAGNTSGTGVFVVYTERYRALNSDLWVETIMKYFKEVRQVGSLIAHTCRCENWWRHRTRLMCVYTRPMQQKFSSVTCVTSDSNGTINRTAVYSCW